MAIKFLSGLNLSGITTGSLLKLDANGDIVAAVAGTDYIASSAPSQWTTSGNDIYYTTGNVGIGETSPDGLLHIKGSAQATEFYIESSTGTASTSGAIKIAQNNRSAEDLAGEMAFYVQDTNVGGLFWREAMTILNSGNVGIGTTAPGNSRLKVSGATEITGNLTLSGLGAGFLKTDANGAVSVDTSTYLTSYTESDTLDSVTDRGATTTNAIGTGNLTINSSSSAASYIYLLSSTTGESELRMGDTDTDAGSIAYNNNLDRMAFRTNAAERVYIDSSGNVGIGTASPNAVLDIQNVNPQIQFTDSVNTSAYSRILGTDAGSLVIDSDRGNAGVNSAIIFNIDGGSEKMRINSTGNVGIGTNSPGAKTHISGGGFDLYLDYSSTNAAIGISSLKKTDGKNALVIGRYHSTNNSAAIRFDYVGDNNSSNYLGLGFYANDDLMVIKPSGNVGIGTTSPSAQLHVSSASSSATSVYVGNTGTGVSRAYFDASNGDFSGADYMWIGQNNDLSGEIVMTQVSGAFHIKTQPGGTITSRLTVLQNGNVGIGTTSPSTKLYVDAGESTFNRGNSAGAIARFRGSNAEKAVIGTVDSWFASNVGIGTTSPSQKLEVVGDIRIGQNSAIRFNTSGSSNDPGLAMLSDASFEFYNTASSTTLKITNGGNVGIGTTSPSQKLHVVGSAIVSTSILVPGAATANSLMHRFGTSGATGSYTTLDVIKTADTSGDFVFMAYAAGVASSTSSPKLIFGHYDATPSNGAVMTIDTSNERVGIGTTSPAYTLTVNGDIQIPQNEYIYFDNTAHYIRRGSSDVEIQGYNGLQLRTNGSTRLYVNQSGNVGIGTTSPAFTLDVNGKIRVGTVTSQSSAILISRRNGANIEFGHGNTTSGYYGTIGVQGSNGQPYFALSSECESSVNTFTTRGFKGNVITTDGAGSLMFTQLTNANATGQSLTERMRIDSSGNVGIGTTSPAYKLDVSGGAIAIRGNAAGNSLRFDDSGGTSRNAMYVDTSNYLNIGNANYAGVKFVQTASSPTAGEFAPNQIQNAIGNTDNGTVLAEPAAWLAVRVGTTDYAIPMYTTG